MSATYATRKEERKAACAAVDEMHRTAGEAFPSLPAFEHDAIARRLGMRPLKPPPTRTPEVPRLTAGAAELAREIRRGTYTPRSGAFLVDLKAHARGEA